MVQFSSNGTQTVKPGGIVQFDDVVVVGNTPVIHREGSGVITLPSIGGCCCMGTGYKLEFSGNITFPSADGTPTGETAATAPISLAIAIGGEPDSNTEMVATPSAADELVNVGRTVIVSTVRGCCSQIALENTSNGTIVVSNPILVVDVEGGVA